MTQCSKKCPLPTCWGHGKGHSFGGRTILFSWRGRRKRRSLSLKIFSSGGEVSRNNSTDLSAAMAVASMAPSSSSRKRGSEHLHRSQRKSSVWLFRCKEDGLGFLIHHLSQFLHGPIRHTACLTMFHTGWRYALLRPLHA